MMRVTMRRWFKAIGIGLGVLIGLFLILQVIPYGRTHQNPEPTLEARWDSPRTRELAVRACFDCHSNETKWPWYANVAPMSWAVQLDVENGRSIVNYSEMDRPYPLAGYSGARTRDGNMPPYKYKMAHPEAQLTPEETEELARGLDRTLGAAAPGSEYSIGSN
jgi:mono/diheme cytochrome c family protein